MVREEEEIHEDSKRIHQTQLVLNDYQICSVATHGLFTSKRKKTNTLLISQLDEQCGFGPLTSKPERSNRQILKPDIWSLRSPEAVQLLRFQLANQLIQLGQVWTRTWIEIRCIELPDTHCTRHLGWNLRQVFSLVTSPFNYVTDKSVGQDQQ